MTNLKKLGLTALAGSLVATTSFAGSLGVSGAAKVTYASQDETESTGNPFSMTRSFTLAGSGEMDNGMTISYHQVLDAGAFSSSGLALDMGDAGTVKFSNAGAGGHGLAAYEDKMPTAGENVWDDMDGQANGVVTMNNVNTISYGTSFAGANVSANYNKQSSGGSAHSVGVDMSPAEGLMVFAAMADKYAGPNSTTDNYTFGATYTTGAVVVGLQRSNIDVSTTNGDSDRTHVAASFAVNEDISISVGKSTVAFEDGSKSDQEDTGFAISYTMGSMTIGAHANSSDNVSGSSGTDDSVKEMSIAFAF